MGLKSGVYIWSFGATAPEATCRDKRRGVAHNSPPEAAPMMVPIPLNCNLRICTEENSSSGG